MLNHSIHHSGVERHADHFYNQSEQSDTSAMYWSNWIVSYMQQASRWTNDNPVQCRIYRS